MAFRSSFAVAVRWTLRSSHSRNPSAQIALWAMPQLSSTPHSPTSVAGQRRFISLQSHNAFPRLFGGFPFSVSSLQRKKKGKGGGKGKNSGDGEPQGIVFNIDDLRQKMDRALDFLTESLSQLRAEGRANPRILDQVQVRTYTQSFASRIISGSPPLLSHLMFLLFNLFSCRWR